MWVFSEVVGVLVFFEKEKVLHQLDDTPGILL